MKDSSKEFIKNVAEYAVSCLFYLVVAALSVFLFAKWPVLIIVGIIIVIIVALYVERHNNAVK